MNTLRKAWCRTYQTVLRIAMPFLPYTEPEILQSTDEVPALLKKLQITNVLLVTDPGILACGLTQGLEDALAGANIKCTVFGETCTNPTVENVETALAVYHEQGCQAVIGFGGGSAMDCAKGVAARVARPDMTLYQMRGVLKVQRKAPPIIAVPTTAGTGSEVTVAAVITDGETKHKFVINAFRLIPSYAVHDWRLTEGLSPNMTSTTGMDALTHAVEAYIGRSTTAYTRDCAERAVMLIHDNLLDAYRDGSNERARRNMLEAAYLAGIAFTRSYVGYVHGVAHSLGGQYGTPHGLANAVALPHVLRVYGASVHRPLARLARLIHVADEGQSDAEAADAFIAWIDFMNASMGIPKYLDCIRREDVPHMARNADAESNPLYPVPIEMGAHELEKLYGIIAGWDADEGATDAATAGDGPAATGREA